MWTHDFACKGFCLPFGTLVCRNIDIFKVPGEFDPANNQKNVVGYFMHNSHSITSVSTYSTFVYIFTNSNDMIHDIRFGVNVIRKFGYINNVVIKLWE